MTTDNDNNTLFQMGSIFAGLLAAGATWYLLSPLLTNVPLVILSIFVFAVTAWGIYEAFAGYGSSVEEPTEVFGEKAVNPSVSKMGLTDRDAWGSSAEEKMTPAKPTFAKTTTKAAAPKAAAKQTTAKPAAKKTTAKTTKAAEKKTAAPKKAAAKKAGPVRLKKANGKADDLKLISGVGPKLEKTLNGLGFWHFSQIAEWKKADVAIVDDELSFKGRIERDDWIKQAKKLAKQKA